jgi:hypothetical protein
MRIRNCNLGFRQCCRTGTGAESKAEIKLPPGAGAGSFLLRQTERNLIEKNVVVEEVFVHYYKFLI